MSCFTRGPWEVDPYTSYPSVRVKGKIEPGARWRIATVGTNRSEYSPGYAEDRANAALIASAPDMYEILNNIYKQGSVDKADLIAIKKILNLEEK